MSWLTCCGCPVITGAAHGIAKATATLFAEAGGRVVLADRDAVAGDGARAAVLQHEQVLDAVAAQHRRRLMERGRRHRPGGVEAAGRLDAKSRRRPKSAPPGPGGAGKLEKFDTRFN